jgi:hypothetical protein
MHWRLIVYRLPTDPSRHRVAVWRELVKAGALSLHQALWAMPDGSEFDESLMRVRAMVERAEGQLFIFEVAPTDGSVAALERLYTEQRDAVWVEFIAECRKFEAEIDRECAKEKFTVAELDEEEQSLDRLTRWYGELCGRDHFGAPSGPSAETHLKNAGAALERFAEAVYQAQT